MNIQGYELPSGTELVVDSANDEIINVENLSHYEKILAAAAEQNIVLKKPKSNCNKCHGKGYTTVSLKTGLPNACICLFDNKQKGQLNSVPVAKNRTQRRAQEKQFRTKITREYLGKSPTKKLSSKRKRK